MMSISVEYCWLAIGLLLCLDIIMVCRLLINQLNIERLWLDSKARKTFLLQLLSGLAAGSRNKITLDDYYEIKQLVQFDQVRQESIERSIPIEKFAGKSIKQLHSIIPVRRKEAAAHLGQLAGTRSRAALEKAILQEKNDSVRLYMANALADIAAPESIPVLIESLLNYGYWYRNKANMLIAGFGEAFDTYLPQIIADERIEIKELIVDFASVYISAQLRSYLLDLIDQADDAVKALSLRYGPDGVDCCANCICGSTIREDGMRACRYKGPAEASFKCELYKVLPVSINYQAKYRSLVYKAAHTLGMIYPHYLHDDRYLGSADVELRNIAITSQAHFHTVENLLELVGFLGDDEAARSAAHAIAQIIDKNPSFMNTLVDLFRAEPDANIKQRMAEILAGKIEYFIMKLTGKNRRAAADIIKQILLLGRSSEIIDFLNKNKDLDLENELAAIVREAVALSRTLETDFRIYLNERLLIKCGLDRCELPLYTKHEKREFKQTKLLYSLLLAVFLIFPVIYCIRHFDILLVASPWEQMRIFIVEFNYYLIFYSAAINLIYLGLLLFSYFKVNKQSRLWKLKNATFLFKSRMLPSISIIAPAYNEEKTIIESANSLLNLKYPDHELIIVNDGSNDSTLEVLIKYFNLVRVDYVFDYKLNTRPIRGIYRSPSRPRLIVVDKENGGKADSLNAGINISNKEYFCGIDADSLLEDDALLKLASLTLDESTETPALGGNVLPINGCTVKRGQITEAHIPPNRLARLQTIEYIRAFMAGRLGWAALNSLLIISGAFGLFRKERIIGIGGYLTSSGKYAKDTVGEDMELVVRISRMLRQMKHRYRICYAFNANCWTQVPEDIKSLKNQRFRWHRGLVDILTFHKQMLFNPRYGRTGMFAMPYFFIFEMIGPNIEFQGYLMVIAAFFLGLLNKEIALLLFITNILMGVLISISALLIAEKDTRLFSLKEMLVLIVYAIIENFGPRQIFSLWRVSAFFDMLKQSRGWGAVQRKDIGLGSSAAIEVEM